MDKYEVNTSWRVLVLDDEEWKLFLDGRSHLNCYKNEFFEFADVVEEYDEEIDTYKAYAHVCFCTVNKEYIKVITEELDK